MNLREFQAKQIFAEHGILVPAARTAVNVKEVRQIAHDLDASVVLKPQLSVKKKRGSPNGRSGAI